jgi:hypothetical protein
LAILQVPIGLSSRPGRFGPEGGSRLINAYAEQSAGESKSPWVYYCRPGLTSFATPETGGPFRGGIDFGAFGYFVLGTTVLKVDSEGAMTTIGAFPGSRPVAMARNRKSPDAQIAVVSDGQRSIISADVITTIADTDLPAPVWVDTIGGYFVFPIEDGRYFWTSIDEGTAVSALDFASAEANPDGLVGVLARTQEIILFGPKSVEFHALTGSSAVFERVPQTTLQHLGCLSMGAVKSINDIPIFPASDGTIRLLNNYSPQRISTHDVERDIDALEDKTLLTAETFNLGGHLFYVLNSPSFSWACDLLTKNWYQWKSYNETRWNAEGFVDVGGKRITGNFEDNELFEIDLEADSDGDADIVWQIITGPVGQFPQRIIADELYVNMLPGRGLNVDEEDEAFDPKVLLRTSDNDGYDWSSEMEQSIGKIGETKIETSFTGLGMSGEDGMRFELTMSAPVSRALTNVALRYQALTP